MRKGKMAAKMAEMRRVAELEVNTDKDNDDVDEGRWIAKLESGKHNGGGL